MIHSKTSLHRLRTVYASLLQLEYVFALVAGVLLGSSKWAMFALCLALTLLLGFVTTALYWSILDDSQRIAS